MARIPEAEIERLKREIALERLVEARGVSLKRKGADLVGRCPFGTHQQAYDKQAADRLLPQDPAPTLKDEPIICGPEYSGPACMSAPGFWGGGSNVNDRRSILNPSSREIIANAEPRVAQFVLDRLY